MTEPDETTRPRIDRVVAPTVVALQRCADYSPERVGEALGALLAGLGGLEPTVQGRRVLIKPNFLTARPADRAVCTHPQVIASLAEAALRAGAREVVVADSPAAVPASRVAEKLGLLSLLAPLGVSILDLRETTEVRLPQGRFPRLLLARQILDAQVVLNLAKMKTHGLCGMTMAVKNCFGAVLGLTKAEWHLRAGHDAGAFAALLVEICRVVAPAISIVDAIDSMDGNGPGAGRVRRTGFLAASTDPFVLDRVLAGICRVPAERVTTFGPDGDPDLSAVQYAGVPPESLTVADWELPSHVNPLFSRLRFLRHFLVPMPRFSRKTCNLCGQCVKLCPKRALSLSIKRVELDDASCIRCFCCQELCPKGAITVHRRFRLGKGLP